MTDMDSAESRQLKLSDRQMKEIIRIILEKECADCQRLAFVGYHFQGKTMTQIAKERGVHLSTVSRELRRAERKVKKLTRYIQIGVSFLIQNYNNMQ